jgi:protein TonB
MRNGLYTALSISLAAGTLFFCFLTLTPKPVLVRMYDLGGERVLIDVRPSPPLKIIPPAVTKRMIPAATVNATPPRIVPDESVTRPLHTLAELSTLRAGEADIEGPPDNGLVARGVVPAAGTGAVQAAPVKVAGTAVFSNPEVMPQFPGGRDGLQRFLIRNLRMPEAAGPGTRISVQATFVIGSDGRLQQVNMSKSGGTAFDAEVKRVLARMPAWIPGRMGNRAVAVYFSLPVQFVVPEE